MYFYTVNAEVVCYRKIKSNDILLDLVSSYLFLQFSSIETNEILLMKLG